MHYKCGTNVGPVQAQRPNVVSLSGESKTVAYSGQQVQNDKLQRPPPPCYFFEIISQPVAQKKPPQAVRRGGHQTYIMQKICSVFFPTAFRSSDRRWYSGFLVREQGNNFFNIYRGDHDFRVVGAPQPFIYTTHVNVHNHTERGGSSEVERGILAKTKEVSQLKSVCWLSFTH